MVFYSFVWYVDTKSKTLCSFIKHPPTFASPTLQSRLFFVGPPKEDIFSRHLLRPLFQSALHITITSLCPGVDTVRFSCLLLCAQNLMSSSISTHHTYTHTHTELNLYISMDAAAQTLQIHDNFSESQVQNLTRDGAALCHIISMNWSRAPSSVIS